MLYSKKDRLNYNDLNELRDFNIKKNIHRDEKVPKIILFIIIYYILLRFCLGTAWSI